MTDLSYENILNGLKKRTPEIVIVLSCALFLLVTHSYRWMNPMFNHDSLLIIQGDHEWQISLGRIFIPFYLKFRGEIVAPGNVAFLSCCYLILSVLMTVRLLRIRRTVPVILCCGLMTTFGTLAFTNATYVHDLDVYMLAMLLSVFGVRCMTDGKPMKNLAGVLCVAGSLGLYQCYIETAVFLVCLIFLRRLLEKDDPKTVFADAVRTAVLLLSSGAIYYVILKTTWRMMGISPAEKYNSLVKMKNLTLRSCASLSLRAWKYTFQYLFREPMIAHQVVSEGLYLALGVFILAGIAVIAVRRRISGLSAVLVLFLLLFMPLGGNAVYVLSSGLKHWVMTYSFVFYSVLAVMILDMLETGSTAAGRVCTAAALACAVLILNQMLFANQLYIRHDLYSQAGLSFMTRLVSRMEQTEGYRPGETPVAILGLVNENPSVYSDKRFDITTPRAGTVHLLPVSYYQTYPGYFHFVLGYPANLVPLSGLEPFIDDPDVLAMPVYPAEGSVKMIDGTLVVRLSENLLPEDLRGFF